MMNIGAKTFTFEEFEAFAAFPENRGRLLELIYGEIVEKVPTPKHSVIAALFATFLNIFVLERKLGVVSVEGRYDVGGQVRLPDVSFISEQILPEKSFSRMPDLAIEIKSPDDTYKGMREKAAFYLQHGSRMV